MHFLLDKIQIKSKMYCCRIYEPDDYGNLEEDEHMHCFVLFERDGKIYHLEHPNPEKKGIYEYATEEEALKTIEDYYVELRGGKKVRPHSFMKCRPVSVLKSSMRISTIRRYSR